MVNQKKATTACKLVFALPESLGGSHKPRPRSFFFAIRRSLVAPLVSSRRSSLLVAAASSSPLASLRRWASLRLCDAARLNADPILMDAGLDGCRLSFLSLLPPLSSPPHSYLTSSPLLFAYPLRRLSTTQTLCRSRPFRRFGFLFAASLLSLFAAQLPSWLFAFFARALRSCEGIDRQLRVRDDVYGFMLNGLCDIL